MVGRKCPDCNSTNTNSPSPKEMHCRSCGYSWKSRKSPTTTKIVRDNWGKPVPVKVKGRKTKRKDGLLDVIGWDK